ncbi:PASTA domain-containing protein [Paraconexibacter algicola]|uniref:PASTA domain-containing protein n=1 Tax=Paraconexibacter algicola TaxID=2133960 RepID=UPI001E55FED2|nr:PASTA domain-containing protein [Paraconexibacter algicola]
MLRHLALALTSALLLSACAETDPADQRADQAPPETITVTRTVIPDAAAAADEPAEDRAPAEMPEPDPEPTDDGGDCITVPAVQGKDHQLAQDTMQAAGLYLLDEEDATGQGRMLIIDRNWTVVEQRPAAGACVDADTTILLRSRKDGE